MRRFKILSDGYPYEKGTIVNENEYMGAYPYPVSWYVDSFPSHWEEIKPSLEDKIKELKELAKSQGMDCDVVLSEKKRIEVSFSNRDNYNLLQRFDFFISSKPNQKLLDTSGYFLAKQLENYLNQETE